MEISLALDVTSADTSNLSTANPSTVITSKPSTSTPAFHAKGMATDTETTSIASTASTSTEPTRRRYELKIDSSDSGEDSPDQDTQYGNARVRGFDTRNDIPFCSWQYMTLSTEFGEDVQNAELQKL